MSQETSAASSSYSIGKTRLSKLKHKALRRGIWFRGLHQIDRALIELTMKVSPLIKSHTLARCIMLVVGKLERALENRVVRLTTEIGVPLTQRLSVLAEKWGHSGARDWVSDLGFAKYLAIMALNNDRNPAV